MNQLNKTFQVLGLMSGTSLDGIDICHAQFYQINKQWNYEIVDAKTIQYSKDWLIRLQKSHLINAEELTLLNFDFGYYLGEICNSFLDVKKVDLIASHGHTVFHNPYKRYTLQIGHGACIASITNHKVVSDFRSQDVALGGQGAPLVPFGDELLFNEYDACINIGGITNISFLKNNERLAFDIAPSNLILNQLCTDYFNLPYDDKGEIAKSGNLNEELFHRLNAWKYFEKEAPKSLGREDIFPNFYEIITEFNCSPEDKLHTFCKHWAFQVNRIIEENNLNQNTLVTGGGAKNQFLMDILKAYTQITVPDETLIDFKEALIFAFLGLMRELGIENSYKSVTGASKNHCSGAVYLP